MDRSYLSSENFFFFDLGVSPDTLLMGLFALSPGKRGVLRDILMETFLLILQIQTECHNQISAIKIK